MMWSENRESRGGGDERSDKWVRKEQLSPHICRPHHIWVTGLCLVPSGRNSDWIDLELRRNWLLYPNYRKSRDMSGMTRSPGRTRTRDSNATRPFSLHPISVVLRHLASFSLLKMVATRGWNHIRPWLVPWFSLSPSSQEKIRISSFGSNYKKLPGGLWLVWLGDVPPPGAKGMGLY